MHAAAERQGMQAIKLSAGTIEYDDTGGSGPVLVLLHGLLMDSSLWDGVAAHLAADHRCLAPTLPLGAHRRAMHADADLSPPAIARLVAEFLDRLDLHDVTLVGNDTGGALVQLLMAAGTDGGAGRIGRAVLVSCDAFDNFPPGLTGKTLVLMGRLSPRVFGLFMQQMRLRAVRRLPVAFGWLTKRGDASTARWMTPVTTQPEIRGDAVRMLRAAGADTNLLLQAAERLPSFDRSCPRGLGKRGQGDAARAWAAPGRPVAARPAGRGRRQLHARSLGPAGPARSARPGVHPRDRLSLPVLTIATSPASGASPATAPRRRRCAARRAGGRGSCRR